MTARRKGKQAQKPTAPVPEVVQQEHELLADVRARIERATRLTGAGHYDAELIALRDAMAEERLSDDQAMLLEQMDRMAALASVREQVQTERIDLDSPYFAHMRLGIEDEGPRDIMLGRRAFVRDGVRIVDWRNAPISRVFYRYAQGDAFAEEIAGRQLEGELEARRVVTIVDGKLVRVAAPEGTFLRSADGWADVSSAGSRLVGGAGSAARPDTAAPLLGAGAGGPARVDKHLPEIAALLDGEQYDLLTRDPTALLVVAGAAGSGKTTVGLHRIAWLAFEQPERFRPARMMVLVFSRALARYISQVLPALGVTGVPVRTLGDWALAARRRHFPDLTVRILPNTPAEVVRFKTHRVLIPMLTEAARAAPNARPDVLFDELFTDRGWLMSGVKTHAPGAFSEAELRRVHRWCTDQQFRRVDPTGRVDEEPAGYDEEDSMILLRLHQLMRGRLNFRGKRKLSYDHVMVDEVQDFSPLELLVLTDTVRDGSLTLAGDPAQRITDNDFSGWEEVLDLLGQDRVQVRPLQVSYRSTRQIMEVARAVLGPLAPPEVPVAPREGAEVELLRFGGRGQAMTFLVDALADLSRREPSASVAVLAPTPRAAQEAYDHLRRSDLAGLSRVADQEFSFGPGIEVSDVAQTKGLEFDYVVLLGVDREAYPATSSARHLLHVGMTRAIHQLWLIAWQPSSSLLPDWLTARLGG